MRKKKLSPLDLEGWNERFPKTKEDCEYMLKDIYPLMARATIPQDYIDTYDKPSHKAQIKRLRERLIGFGYSLMMQLDEAIEHPDLLDDMYWQQAIQSTHPQFFLSIEQIYLFTEERRKESDGFNRHHNAAESN